jgi:hypothetical protein
LNEGKLVVGDPKLLAHFDAVTGQLGPSTDELVATLELGKEIIACVSKRLCLRNP